MSTLDITKRPTDTTEPPPQPAPELRAPIDNLLRFVNRAASVDELACGFDGELAEVIRRCGQAILDLRDDRGALYGDDDLVLLEDVICERFAAVLKAARYPLVVRPPRERFVAIAYDQPPLLIDGFVGSPVLFAINWVQEPAEWAKFVCFGIELNDKRLGLSLDEKRLRDSLANTRQRLAEARAKRTKAMAATPRDQDLIDQLSAAIATDQRLVATRQSELDAVLREAEALNDHIRNRNLAGARKIVEANLRLRLDELTELRQAAIRTLETSTNRAQRAGAEARRRSYLAENTAIVQALNKIKAELG